MAETVTVTKRNWRGETVYSWQGEVHARDDGHIVLRAVWNGPGTVNVAGEVTFSPGDVFYEHYYDGKPYGLWQVLTPDERALKCWYCNISTPATFGDHTIAFDDLLLDVLLLPDGRRLVLDRDDLEGAINEGLDPAPAATAEEGVREVLALIERRQPPFDSLQHS